MYRSTYVCACMYVYICIYLDFFLSMGFVSRDFGIVFCVFLGDGAIWAFVRILRVWGFVVYGHSLFTRKPDSNLQTQTLKKHPSPKP